MKKQLDLAASIVAFLTVTAFAVYLLFEKVPMNIASFVLWTALNGVSWITMVRAGSRVFLPAGYTISTALVVIILVKNGVWAWGAMETVALIGAMAALFVSFKTSKRFGVVLAVSALLLAGIPQFYDNWTSPATASWWLWVITACCNATSLFSAESTLEGRLYPAVGTATNSLQATLVIRGFF
ncbi:MAG: hypothetical protein AAB527_02345 [Patescibacteria group bacterium]